MALVKANWFDGETTLYATTDVEEVTGATVFGLQAVFTGGPTYAVVVLQGSLDGATWFGVLSLDPSAPPHAPFVWANGIPVKYIRLQVTHLDGGTDPAVTASVIAV